VQLSDRPLIITQQLAEHLRGKRHQPGPDLCHLLTSHPEHMVARTDRELAEVNS